MRVVGCDPGISGALALHDTVGPSEVCDLPTVGEGKTEELDAKLILRQIAIWAPDLVVLERAMAMPRRDKDGNIEASMGAASSFKFGKGYGQLVAVVQIAGFPWERVMPGVWKRFWKLPKDKERARQLALQKCPDLHHEMRFKYHHQRAEALLIAMYGAAVFKFPSTKRRRDSATQLEIFDGR